METETEELIAGIAALEKEKEKKDNQQSEDSRNILRQQKNVERYLGKRVLLIQRKDECNKNIRDLGVLPESAFIETTASSEKVVIIDSSVSAMELIIFVVIGKASKS